LVYLALGTPLKLGLPIVLLEMGYVIIGGACDHRPCCRADGAVEL
jgi:hypothetical protein